MPASTVSHEHQKEASTMKANEGTIDRVVRVVLGIGSIAVAWFALHLADGDVIGIGVAGVGAVFTLTGLFGFCPAYRIFGLDTCPLTGRPIGPDSHPDDH
jgi:Inner membrane protein YgaP-like, transmembrane domain